LRGRGIGACPGHLLIWHKQLRLIDHGAALYFHHSWDDETDRSQDPFTRIKDHILLQFASSLREADATMTRRITPDVIQKIVAQIPDTWLGSGSRNAYIQHLTRRVAAPRAFLEEAIRARSLLV
jgi:hypothetical protein